jgi:signal peptidase I
MKKDLKGTWSQALLTFFTPILLVVGVRWILFEPFVIPSGSMIPTLLIHDHIFVNKLAFGIQAPFGHGFLVKWGHPTPGEIVVFRYPPNPDVFYVKRVVAVAGDEIEVKEGVILINGKPYSQELIPEQNFEKSFEQDFDYFKEKSQTAYIVRYQDKEASTFGPKTVPEGHFFAMGDNRDQSSDSRFWGFVPESNLVGTSEIIWLSCDQTLASAQFLCDPSTIRWDRLLKNAE